MLALHSDRGGEYLSNVLTKDLIEHGIVKRHTVVYSPICNGIAERMNSTLLELHFNVKLKTVCEFVLGCGSCNHSLGPKSRGYVFFYRLIKLRVSFEIDVFQNPVKLVFLDVKVGAWFQSRTFKNMIHGHAKQFF